MWILLLGLGFNLFLLGYFKYAGISSPRISACCWAWTGGSSHCRCRLEFRCFHFSRKLLFSSTPISAALVSFDLLHYSLFVTFFPQLIAGPIVRHNEIIPQFCYLPRTPRASDFAIGGSIFAIGLFKKVCLADLSAPSVNPVFLAAASGGPVSFVDAWIAALAYSFQLYFDFSGYTDMAIGLARLFGVVLPINFYSPYKSVNIIDFWRRWHISLSRFLRDFIYIPLGGNRRGGDCGACQPRIAMLLRGTLAVGEQDVCTYGAALHGLMLVLNHAWHYLRRRIGLPPGNDPVSVHIAACALTFGDRDRSLGYSSGLRRSARQVPYCRQCTASRGRR